MKTTTPLSRTLLFTFGLVLLLLVQTASASRVGSWVSGAANLQDTSGFMPPGTHDGYAVSTNGLTSLAWSADVPSGFSGQSLDFSAGSVAVVITNTCARDGASYLSTFTGSLTSRFSFALWYRVTGPVAERSAMFSKRGLIGAPGGYYCSLETGGEIQWRMPPNVGGGGLFMSPAYTNEVWYHIAAVLDAGRSNEYGNSRSIYVNGQFVTNEPGTWGILDPTNHHLCIGALENNTLALNNFWRGKLYDVRVYDMLLTSNNIIDIMNPASTARHEAIMLTFDLPGITNGVIDQSAKTISLTVPYGTPVTNLAPTLGMSYEAKCNKSSGSEQDFSTPQQYAVVSLDNQVTNTYTVTVTVIPASTAKDILTFGPGATITGTNIAWDVPYGIPLNALAPTYTVSEFATGNPPSGSTNDFTTPLSYRVTAQDLSAKDYRVTAIPGKPTIVWFGLTGMPATITGTNILWPVRYGTDRTSLSPIFELSALDATCDPPSGTTRDFTTPKTYVVTSPSNLTNVYTVTVVDLPTATNYFWTNTVDGVWSMDGNWTNSEASAFGPYSNGFSFYKLNFNVTGASYASNDLAEGFLVNQINYSVSLNGNGLTLTNDGNQLPQISASVSWVGIANNLFLATNVACVGGNASDLSGEISGPGGLVVNVGWRLRFVTENMNGPNTYAGGTILNGGILTYINDSTPSDWKLPFGTGPVTINGGALNLRRSSVSNVNTIVFNGGQIYNDDGFGSDWSGPVVLNTNAVMYSDAGALRLYGPLSGGGGLAWDHGTLGLYGTNTYHGSTTIGYDNTNGIVGTVEFNGDASLAPGHLTICSGSVAMLNYTGTRYISALTYDGIAQPDGEYGAIGSSAPNQSAYFSNSVGTVTVMGSLSFVDITDPSPVFVDLGQTNIVKLAGTNNQYVVGYMWISNTFNDAVATFAASASWTSAPVVVGTTVGDTNMVFVYGTNAAGIVASDSIMVISVPEPAMAGAVLLCVGACIAFARRLPARSSQRRRISACPSAD